MINCDYYNNYFEIDYNNYKKDIIKLIFDELQVIYNIFNEKVNQNLFKLFILFTKNKFTNNLKNIFNELFEFIFNLNKLEYIDQQEYLSIVIKLIKIDDELKKNIDIIVDNKYIKLLDITIISSSINECIEILIDKNLLIKKIIKFITNDKINKTKYIKNISSILAIDFFTYYNANDMYTLLINNFSIFNSTNYKNIFIKNYDDISKKYINIYKYDMTLLKYKIINTNLYFNELIHNFTNLITDNIILPV